MTAIRINHAERKIILSSAFEKKASIPGSAEYDMLQTTRIDNPGYALVTRKFKTNTKQEHYRGLTYPFMREYIKNIEGKDAHEVLAEFEGLITDSKCHSLGRRYPTIKKWFLDRYPNIAEFGMTDDEYEEYRIGKLVEAENAELTSKISA